jgi:threonine dehydratase
VATIICGGNIDVNAISQIIECGLMDTGRRIKLSMNLIDRPGSLSALINHVSEQEANVYVLFVFV